MSDQRAIVSYNDNGFWQADLFDGDADEPDAFFTMSVNDTAEQCADKAKVKWPLASVEIICAVCSGDGEIPVDDDDGVCQACDGFGKFVKN